MPIQGVRQKGGGVSPYANVKRVAQGDVSGISSQNIPGLTDIRPVEDHHKDPHSVVIQIEGKQHQDDENRGKQKI